MYVCLCRRFVVSMFYYGRRFVIQHFYFRRFVIYRFLCAPFKYVSKLPQFFCRQLQPHKDEAAPHHS
jgi:hypothetical protein